MHRTAAASLLHQSVGATQSVQVQVQEKQTRARTLHPPPPRAVLQPQACYISCRCFMLASIAQTKISAGAWCWQQALSTQVPEPETSTHLAPAFASHRRCSSRKLAALVGASWRLPLCRPQSVHVRGRGSKHSPSEYQNQAAPVAQTTISADAWSWRQALSIRVPKAETSTHLESAFTSHRTAATSLLYQLSVLHGVSRCADHK